MNKNINTFLEYLTDRFYDYIYKKVNGFCHVNRDFILSKTKDDVYKIEYFEDEELNIDFKTVWIENKNNPLIEMDIVAEVTCIFSGVTAGKYHNHDSFDATFWINIYCKGSMNKGLDDFRIVNIEEFYKNRPTKPLSGDLVPIISKNQYDSYATDFLKKYYPEALIEPIEINVDELAKRMKLNVLNHSLSTTNTVFGQCYFSDAVATIYDDGIEQEIPINKDTIIIDDEASFLRSYGSRNMTVVHECVHSYLHRPAFEFAKLIDSSFNYIKCVVDGVMSSNNQKSIKEWMEIQANALSPCILMPAESVIKYVNQIIAYIKDVSNGLEWINNVVQAVADKFGVTIYAARKRLIDLGFEFAIGSFNWIDGHYVRPYTFKKGTLNSNETFTIDFIDVANKLFESDVFYELMQGRLQFIENHLCVNNHLYIEKDSSGKSILTDYALMHMDECCVKFIYKTIKGFSSGSEFGLMCYLCRDCTKEIEFDLYVIKKGLPTILNDPSLEIRYRIHQENVEEVWKAISPLSFGKKLDYLLKYLDIPPKELALDAGLSSRTINRYLNDEIDNPEKRTIVAIIRALNVPYKIADDLIKASGFNFGHGKEDDLLLQIMQLMREEDIDDVNDFLVRQGYKPLTNN